MISQCNYSIPRSLFRRTLSPSARLSQVSAFSIRFPTSLSPTVFPMDFPCHLLLFLTFPVPVLVPEPEPVHLSLSPGSRSGDWYETDYLTFVYGSSMVLPPPLARSLVLKCAVFCTLIFKRPLLHLLRPSPVSVSIARRHNSWWVIRRYESSQVFCSYRSSFNSKRV